MPPSCSCLYLLSCIHVKNRHQQQRKTSLFLSLLYDLLHKKTFFCILNKLVSDVFFIIAVLREKKTPINIDRKLPQTKTINTPSNKENV